MSACSKAFNTRFQLQHYLAQRSSHLQRVMSFSLYVMTVFMEANKFKYFVEANARHRRLQFSLYAQQNSYCLYLFNFLLTNGIEYAALMQLYLLQRVETTLFPKYVYGTLSHVSTAVYQMHRAYTIPKPVQISSRNAARNFFERSSIQSHIQQIANCPQAPDEHMIPHVIILAMQYSPNF